MGWDGMAREMGYKRLPILCYCLPSRQRTQLNYQIASANSISGSFSLQISNADSLLAQQINLLAAFSTITHFLVPLDTCFCSGNFSATNHAFPIRNIVLSTSPSILDIYQTLLAKQQHAILQFISKRLSQDFHLGKEVLNHVEITKRLSSHSGYTNCPTCCNPYPSSCHTSSW